MSTFPGSPTIQQAAVERLDDIAQMLRDAGSGKATRADLTRALIFALPIDSADHMRRIIQVGRLRMYEDVGHAWSAEALGEAEGLLGWYCEDVERAELVREIERLRGVIRGLKWRLTSALEDVQKALADVDEEVPQ